MVGWLAIVGVPPFSGFWSKGDVLTNVWAKSPGLWVVGAVTALLTAYYMSRLFFLTFTGRARWQEAVDAEHPAHHTPHEPSWIMRTPLVLLAIFAAVAGILDLPWVHHYSLSNFLAPVFGRDLYQDNASTLNQWLLASIDAVLAVIGIAIAWQLWRARADRPELEPTFLQRVWHWDDVYDAVFGRPGQVVARFCATVVDARVIDGAVNGVAALVRGAGSGVRRLQTGYVRNYALAISLGLAGFIVFMLSRALS
jgi:NADH-quinone oxidoreductase subunit L